MIRKTLAGLCLLTALFVAAEPAAAAPLSPPAAPVAPAACKTGRNLRGWQAGVSSGQTTVHRLWVQLGEDPAEFDELQALVVDTLSTTLSSYLTAGIVPYASCRAQGYLDGAVYRLRLLRPLVCVLDGADWATITANFYCDLSVAFGGLPLGELYLRAPAGVCGDYFQTTCEDVYRNVASNGSDPLDPELASFLWSNGTDPASLPYGPACVAYTRSPHRAVFDGYVHNDCSYEVVSPE
jgi:hypothetical protein